MNNPLSFSAIKLNRLSREGESLNSASGFVVEAGNQYYLITNWHVVSGRDINTHELLEPDLEPVTLNTAIHIRQGEGEKKAPLTMGRWKRLTVQLYDDDNMPRWIELPANNEQLLKIDVVAIPLKSNLNSFQLVSAIQNNFIDSISTRSNMNFWSEISAISISAIDTEIEYGPSDLINVVGHPYGWSPNGTDKSTSAFWRRSSIASEIKETGIGITTEYPFFIDPCPLDGMTGSPVLGLKNDCIRLLGIYSDISTAGFGANAGLVWNASVLKDLISLS